MNERDLQDMRDESLPEGEPQSTGGARHEPASASAGSRYSDTGASPSESDPMLLLKEAGFEVYGWVPMEADE